MDTLTESRHRYLCVDGPIAVGKTTLSRMLSEHYGARLVLEEFDENPFLREFYQDPHGAAFQTQIYFLISRYQQQLELLQQELFRPTIVSDYLFAKDRIFAYMNLNEEEIGLYEKIYDILHPKLLKPDLVIYLKACPKTLVQRMKKRGREFETSVKKAYLEKLMAGYNGYFRHYDESPLLILDTSYVDFEKRPDDFQYIIEVIESHTEGHKYLTPNKPHSS